MELGEQIKKYRKENSLTQDLLAEKVYVSRQTISNWENDKSYPDVNSLVLLSEIFHVSLDQLIKGDVKMMKEQINKQISKEDQKKFNRLSQIYAGMLVAAIVTPIPLVHYLSYVGMGIWVVILGAALYVAMVVEKEKKKLNVQTYKEILAFMDGESLDEIERAREEGKRPYQKIFMAVAVGAVTLIVSIIFLRILGV